MFSQRRRALETDVNTKGSMGVAFGEWLEIGGSLWSCGTQGVENTVIGKISDSLCRGTVNKDEVNRKITMKYEYKTIEVNDS